MKLYQMVFSPTGGTEKVAEILSRAWDCEQETVNLLAADRDYGLLELSADDICIVSVPSFGGRVPAVALERLSKIKGNQAKTVLVVVYGNRAYEDTLLELKDTLEDAGFFCTAAVTAVAEHSIMRQFAAGRPDETDVEELTSFAEQIRERLEGQADLKPVTVPGNHPYREYGGVPFHPKADKTCTKCGLCARECPVHAIPNENPSETDDHACISCMRCIAVCPNQARKLNKMMLTVASQKMKKAFAEPKKNELFI